MARRSRRTLSGLLYVGTAVAVLVADIAIAGPALAGAERPKKLPEGWTPWSHWAGNADGTVTRTIYPQLSFHTDAQGTWVPIDPAVVAARDEAGPDAATVPDGIRPVAFGRDAKRLVELQLDGGDVTLSAAGLTFDKPVVSEDGVTYVDGKRHAAVTFTSGLDGVKQEVTIGDATAPRTYRFHLADPAGVLGNAVPTEDGGYRFDKPVADGLYLTIPAPFAYEEATGPDATAGAAPSATLEISRHGAGFDIVESVDPAWLKGKTFPIVLDPTLTYQGAPRVTDCAVTSNPAGLTTPDCANGTSQVGADATGARRVLLRYDTSGFPQPSQVTGASVLVTTSATPGSNMSVELREAGAWWTTGATWLTKDGTSVWPAGTVGGAPGTTVLGSGTLIAGGTQTALTSGDLATLVANWINGTTVPNGLVLMAPSETAPGPGFATIATTENATGAAWPALQITYIAPPDAPGSLIATRGDQSASLTWTAPANNGSPITGYTIKAYDAAETLVSTTTAAAGATGKTVTGLTNGTAYHFRVSASNAIGTGPEATSNTVTPAGVPFAPAGVSATRGDRQATVSWTAANPNGSAVTANAVKAWSGSTLVSTTNVGAVTTATVTGLTNGISYTFTVTATNDVGTGSPSASSNAVTPAGVPFAPTGVTAVPGTASATVSWTAANPNGAAVTGNTVSAYQGTTLVTTTGAGAVTTATVPGLTNGTTYTFTVKATNDVGTGAESSVSNAVVAGAPGLPAAVTATRGDTSASVSWTAAPANAAAISGSTIKAYQGTTLVSSTPVSGAATSGTVTGLTNGTAYTFKVTSTNTYGTGPESAPSNAVTPAGAPFAPANVAATAGDTQATVTWTAPGGNGAAITGYTIKAYDGATVVQTTTAAAGATSKTVTGLTNGTAYSFTVAATNDVGTGPVGTSNTVTPAGVPFAPGNVAATAGDTQLTATWTAPNPNGSAITGYTVKTYTGPTLVSTTTATAGATSKTVTGLTNGTAYYATVAATNAVGTGPTGTSNTVTPAGLPGAPTAVTATRGDTSAAVSWTAPGSNGSAITGYSVKAYAGPTLVSATNVGNVTSTTVTGLTNGTAYTFKVSATNGVGTGADSAASSAVTPAGLPFAPSGVTATAGDQSATVTWTAAGGNGTAITGNVIKAYQGTTLVSSTSVGNVTSGTVTGLTNGTAYTFTVTATNDAGTGPASAVSNAVTPAGLPFAPTSVTAEPANAAAVVSWTAPGGNGATITSYAIRAYVGSTLSQTATITAPASSGTITGLTNGTTYTFKVAATNSAGTGAESAASGLVTVGVPGVPTGVSATGGDTQATVSWTAPAANGAAISSYTVAAYQGSTAVTTASAGGGATSAVVTGLTNGITYTFTVTAANTHGSGRPSANSNGVSPAGLPFAPGNVSATDGDQSATVVWTAANGNGLPVTGYDVKAYVGGTLFSTTPAGGTATSLMVTGLTNGTAYTFTVTAINSLGAGTPSSHSSAVTPAGVPFAPASVTATAGDTTAVVTWTAANGNGAVLTAYRITVFRADGTPQAPIDTDAAATQTTLTGLTNGASYTVSVAGVNRVGTGIAATSAAVVPVAATTPAGYGQYVPLTPARIVDTRSGLGGVSSPLGAAATQPFTLTGVGGVPETGVSAVAVSVTAITPSSAGYLTVWPTGRTRPQVSQVTFAASTTTASLVVAKLGTDGQISVYNSAGTTHVLLDIEGYYTDNTASTGAGRFAALTPARIVDTRSGLGNGSYGTTPLAALESRAFAVTGTGGVPASGVQSVAVAVTVANATTSGYFTVYRNGDTRPGTSNLNFAPGMVVTALVMVPVDADGKIAVYNGSSGTAAAIMDIEGYFTTGTGSGPSLYVPVNPARIYNSTTGLGNGGVAGPLANGETRSVQIAGAVDVNSTTIIPSGATAAVLAVQAVAPTGSGWFQGYPAGEARPGGSIHNFSTTSNYTTTFIAKVGTGGKINMYAATGAGTAGLVIDVMGYFQTTAPSSTFLSTTIQSSDYPMNGWPSADRTSGLFTFSTWSTPDRFVYAVDDPALTSPMSVNADGFGDATITLSPPGGWHTLYVAAIDVNNVVGATYDYPFGAGQPGITSPVEGAHVQGTVPLSARVKAGYSGVTWNYRRGSSEAWTAVPVADVTNNGAAVAAWPVATTQSGIDSVVPTLTWKAPQTLGIDGPVTLQACFTPSGGGAAVCASPLVNVVLDRGGDANPTATAAFGPGSLNLVTGNLTAGATDVSVDSFASDLTVSRSYNTGSPIRAVPGAYEHLSGNQADVETGTTGFTGTRATVTQVSTPVFSQSGALQISPNATGLSNDTYAHIGGDSGGLRLGMQAGHSYTFTTHIFVPASTGAPVLGSNARADRVVAFWEIAPGVLTELQSAAAAPPAYGKWQELSIRFTVPAGAAQAFIRLYNGRPTADMPGGATNKPVYYDRTSLTDEGVFGPGWVPSLPVASADSTYAGLTDYGTLVSVHDGDGSTIVFAKNSAGQFKPTGDDAKSGLTLKPATIVNGTAATWTLTDLGGNVTVFVPSTSYGSAPTTSSPHAYRVESVTQPGSALKTTYTYDGNGRVSEMKAPVPPDATCNSGTWTQGCRALVFSYSDSGHVTEIGFKTTDNAGTTFQEAVACYVYDEGPTSGNTGRLTQTSDPRIQDTGGVPITCGNPILPATYGYDAAGRLSSIKPAGLQPLVLGYDSSGRISTVTRTHGGGGSEVSTVKYGIPATPDASFAYYRPDMSATSVARWGQTDVPVTAVAIFAPGLTVPADPVTDARNAAVSYLSATGRIVNTASFGAASATDPAGWHVDLTAYDTNGGVVRTLDEANLELALNPSAAPPGLTLPAGTAAAAAALSTVNVYSADGMDLVDTFGPYHLAMLPGGTEPVGVRSHTHHSYDTGAELAHPAGPPLHVETAVYTAASQSSAAQATNEVDRRTTTKAYALSASDATGWTFQSPMRVTTDPDGLAMSAVTRFDAKTGLAVETRMPSNPTGGGAGSTIRHYYTGDASSPDPDCRNKLNWVNLLCKELPVAQPVADGTTSGLVGRATKWHKTYDYLNRATVVEESAPGGTTRTTTTAYENSGMSPRLSSVQVTGGLGTAVPTKTTSYDASTGLVTSVSAGTTSVTTGYDDFGRVTSYDEDGSGSVAAVTTSYDSAGRVATVTDAKRSRTYGYNAGGERRGLTTSVAVSVASYSGTFTASYGSGGELVSQSWPNGVTQTLTRDQAGQLVQEKVQKASTVWLDESVVPDAFGHVRKRSATIGATSGSPGGTWWYTYDAVNRLTKVTDQPAGGGACATRTYTYDANSNRLSATAYPAGTGGVCQSSTGGSVVPHSYDAADRLLGIGTDKGLSYDALGRTTVLPAADTSNLAAGAVTATYYADDMVRSLTQGTSSQTWTLDAAARLAKRTDQAGVEVTNHYADGSDSPAWVAENTTGGQWTANVIGLDGSLVATVDHNSAATWQVTNLHGDVVATAAGSANQPSAGFATDEFGVPQGVTPGRYGWLGGKQRAADTPGGLSLMGVRLYVPALGRFLQVDPVPGGSLNAYEYAGQDPLNTFDLDGRKKCKGWRKWACKIGSGLTTVGGVIGGVGGAFGCTWCVAIGGSMQMIGAAAYLIGGDTQRAARSVISAMLTMIVGAVPGAFALRSGRIGLQYGKAYAASRIYLTGSVVWANAAMGNYPRPRQRRRGGHAEY